VSAGVAVLAALGAAVGCGGGSGTVRARPGATTAGSTTPATTAPCNTGGWLGAADGYVGLTLAQAERLATRNRKILREIGADGACALISQDLRADRVDVYLEHGRVTWAASG